MSKTLTQRIEDKLTQNGLSKKQIETILPTSLARISKEHYVNFNVSESRYEETIFKLIYNLVKSDVYDWLVINKPQAWFLPMFKN